MLERRPLSFAALGDVMPDVDRLLEGHVTAGNWSLAQICNHLSSTLISSVDGSPHAAPRWLRLSIGPLIGRHILKTGRMREGIGLPESARPKSGLDARAEAEALRAALSFYGAHTGPLAAHPFFGPWSRDQWTRLHCIHCAHHLSFVLPVASAREIAGEPIRDRQ